MKMCVRTTPAIRFVVPFQTDLATDTLLMMPSKMVFPALAAFAISLTPAQGLACAMDKVLSGSISLYQVKGNGYMFGLLRNDTFGEGKGAELFGALRGMVFDERDDSLYIQDRNGDRVATVSVKGVIESVDEGDGCAPASLKKVGKGQFVIRRGSAKLGELEVVSQPGFLQFR